MSFQNFSSCDFCAGTAIEGDGISGTDFYVAPDPESLRLLDPNVWRRWASPEELEAAIAECQAGRAICASCADGVIVFGPRVEGGRVELFVFAALAFAYGALDRQAWAVDAIARDLGAEAVVVRNRRPGLERKLGAAWKRRGVDLVKEM